MAQTGPSYECANARLATEIAVCGDRGLSAADLKMATLYRQVFRATPDRERRDFRDEQLLWQRWRNSCAANVNCLARRYQDRIDDFNVALGRPVSSGPGPDDIAAVRLNGDRYERVYGDGRISWTTGDAAGTIYPDGTQDIYMFQQVLPDDFPTLPGSANAWVAALESSLLTVIYGLLPPEDHDAYGDLNAGLPLDTRMFRHVDAISFLSSQ
ncbi:MAG: hypothetical protein AAFY65_00155 [Pseudomonadota bacterium]